MAVVERDLGAPGIPAKTTTAPIAPKVLKTITNDPEADQILLQATDGSLRLKGTRGEFIRRALVGNYTDYDIEKRVVYSTKTRIDRGAFRALLDALTLLKTSGGSTCDFTWAQGALDAEHTSPIDGTVKSCMAVEWPHPPVKIRLDPTLLCEAVKAADAEQIEVAMGDDKQPFLLREEHDGMLYLYALSPRF
jgi:DNA polymerase III sliding clamp (beta) subunit (PCNA family)